MSLKETQCFKSTYCTKQFQIPKYHNTRKSSLIFLRIDALKIRGIKCGYISCNVLNTIINRHLSATMVCAFAPLSLFWTQLLQAQYVPA